MAKQYIPAPKPILPGHNESYNPPEEYLPTEEERQEWEVEHPLSTLDMPTSLLDTSSDPYQLQNTDPEERETNWLPTKFNSLRQVPLYEEASVALTVATVLTNIVHRILSRSALTVVWTCTSAHACAGCGSICLRRT